MSAEVRQTAIGGDGKKAEVDGGYFGGYVKPANRREDAARRNRPPSSCRRTLPRPVRAGSRVTR